ncbi:2,5-diamino-6-ribosylamino-4(3H)-pyrimidinone 5'-phosphate reductase [Zancudomyces culisetae]|uniref:2,5-diamino-6-ribosylamino-4(3H)-pyrimidinone 5'-phosphate reductase n=1 Tax=Zancudomyces culisetae TaxID=1213189 RepID=A0A1R1PX03_ZANCU|nr:2,5-diamino-6-ribosylamino-4(3H)-pyrimidinone 5'-phosphate reductase [Zancudomyces culisetae]|eukprot:OMH85454.1 2,5-diamino-6-ribosylamino-4(3H)-pyrimidinone 5'-phosphate reductase [Zancudomyces culisetae]
MGEHDVDVYEKARGIWSNVLQINEADPQHTFTPSLDRPFVTLTFAQSIDSKIAVRLSVNSENVRYPQPIILDNNLNFPLDCKLLQMPLVDKKCHYPWIITKSSSCLKKKAELEAKGAIVILVDNEYCDVNSGLPKLTHILRVLKDKGISKLMVEGGATIIQQFINAHYIEKSNVVDAVAITIAPVFVGSGGLGVSDNLTSRSSEAVDTIKLFQNNYYERFGDDIVVAGRTCAL